MQRVEVADGQDPASAHWLTSRRTVTTCACWQGGKAPASNSNELILSQMAQKPMLRGEVGARALRVRSDVRGHGQVRLCKALGCGKCGCLKPIRACCVVKSAFFLVAPPRGGFAMAPRDSGRCWKQFMMCLEEIGQL